MSNQIKIDNKPVVVKGRIIKKTPPPILAQEPPKQEPVKITPTLVPEPVKITPTLVPEPPKLKIDLSKILSKTGAKLLSDKTKILPKQVENKCAQWYGKHIEQAQFKKMIDKQLEKNNIYIDNSKLNYCEIDNLLKLILNVNKLGQFSYDTFKNLILSFYENHDIKKIIDSDKINFDLRGNYCEYKNTIYQLKSSQIFRYNNPKPTTDFIFFELEYIIPVIEKMQVDDMVITWNPLVIKRNEVLYDHNNNKVLDSCDQVIEKVFFKFKVDIKKMLNECDMMIKKIILKENGYKFICDDNYGFEIENNKIGKITDFSETYKFNFVSLTLPCSYYNLVLDMIKETKILDYDKIKNKIKCSNIE